MLQLVIISKSLLPLFILAIFAIAWNLGTPALALDPPTINVGTKTASGSYLLPPLVSMSASAGTIYYTTDGSTPTTSSTQYTSQITISKPTQINAVAWQSGTYSAVTTAFLDVDPNLAAILRIPQHSTEKLILRLRSGLGTIFTPGSPPPLTFWADLSRYGTLDANNNNATSSSGSQPTLVNTLFGTAIDFNGAGQFLSLPTDFSTYPNGANIFIVCRPTSANSYLFDLGNSNFNDEIDLSTNSSVATYHIKTSNSYTASSSPNTITQNSFQLIEGIQGGNSGQCMINGISGSAITMATPLFQSRSMNFIGKRMNGSNFFSGQIAEVLFYNFNFAQATTIAMQTDIEAYLMQKYQMLTSMPPAPSFAVQSGVLNGPTQVAITSQFDTVTYVTTDGTTPTISSPVYSGPMTVSYSQTIKAMSAKGGITSSVVSATYTLDANQWPAPDPGDTTAPTINLQLPTASQ